MRRGPSPSVGLAPLTNESQKKPAAQSPAQRSIISPVTVRSEKSSSLADMMSKFQQGKSTDDVSTSTADYTDEAESEIKKYDTMAPMNFTSDDGQWNDPLK